MRSLKPTVLIGACGQGGAFGKAVVEAMASHVARPMILPLSNPTSQSEAVPSDLIAWTDGRALVAAGSPFDPEDFEFIEIKNVGPSPLNLFNYQFDAGIFPTLGFIAIAEIIRRARAVKHNELSKFFSTIQHVPQR